MHTTKSRRSVRQPAADVMPPNGSETSGSARLPGHVAEALARSSSRRRSAGAAAAVALVKTSPRVYTASAQIFVAASSQNNTAALNNGNTFAQARVQSYTSVANSPAITDAVVKQLASVRSRRASSQAKSRPTRR